MNTQSNALPESFNSQKVTPTVMSTTQPMYWSVRRELWENRSIYIAPLGVAALFLFGFMISLIGLPGKMRAAVVLSPMEQLQLITQPYILAEGLIMATTFIVTIFYCLDALHGERRDRSILFWKSLPVSDFTTVLSKMSIPLVVMPLLTFTITVAVQVIMLLLSSAVLLASGLSPATLWTHLSLFQMWLMLLYHLLTIHALWYAPIWSWLLLVSAWARRAPFLWAVLPPLVVGMVEKIAFNTMHLVGMLRYRMTGGPEGVSFAPDGMSMDMLAQLTPGQFLISPGLWIGLIIMAAFLASAVRLRRYRGPI
jgi:ABC-2 type transport system permease protein